MHLRRLKKVEGAASTTIVPAPAPGVEAGAGAGESTPGTGPKPKPSGSMDLLALVCEPDRLPALDPALRADLDSKLTGIVSVKVGARQGVGLLWTVAW